MAQHVSPDSGTYILLIVVDRALTLPVGSLGNVAFVPGHYLYVGSALRNLRARLVRHARREKRIHWHIDVLLAHARLVEAWVHVGRERLECAWAHALAERPDLVPWGRRFGASDCRCATHLFRVAEHPTLDALRAALPGGEDVDAWAIAHDV